MGKPAARKGDWHFCTKSEGPKPHIGGVITHGDKSVLIAGQPAARVGDQVECKGPPDKIKEGSRSVKIGGRGAARLGDKTVHDGCITVGCMRVLIG